MGSLMRRVPFWGDKNVMGLEVVVAKKKKNNCERTATEMFILKWFILYELKLNEKNYVKIHR